MPTLALFAFRALPCPVPSMSWANSRGLHSPGPAVALSLPRGEEEPRAHPLPGPVYSAVSHQGSSSLCGLHTSLNPLTPGSGAGAVLADLRLTRPPTAIPSQLFHTGPALPLPGLKHPQWFVSRLDPGADILTGTQASAPSPLHPLFPPHTTSYGLPPILSASPSTFAHTTCLSGV